MFEIKFEFEFTFSVGVSVSELDGVSGSRLSNHRSPAGPRADGAGGQGVPPGKAVHLSPSPSLSLSLSPSLSLLVTQEHARASARACARSGKTRRR